MLVVLLIVFMFGLALAAYYAVGTFRARRKPRELRGDWWTPFERQFRAYAKHSAKSPRHDTRRRGR